MAQVNRIPTISALLLSLTVLCSATAAAQQPTLQNAVADLIAAQGQLVMTEISTQLMQSIKNEISELSFDNTEIVLREVSEKSTQTVTPNNQSLKISADE